MQHRVRSGDSAYFDIEAPHVHRHFLFSDADADVLGFTEVELCCHGCGASQVIQAPAPPQAPIEPPKCLLRVQREFKEKHVSCPSLAGDILCPPHRSRTETVDVRAEVNEELGYGKRRRGTRVS